MGGREAVPQMHFTKVPCDDPEVTIFGISGSLGPRARPYLNRLMEECRQRDLRLVILDLSEVESLGGGTAQLLNEFAVERDAAGLHTAFVVVSPIVRSFLCRDESTNLQLFVSLDEALAAAGSKGSTPADTTASGESGGPAPFVEDVSWDASVGLAPERQLPDEERVRAAIVHALHVNELASRAHVLSLQADGSYHPVTRAGIDLERGIPAHGVLAQSLLQQPGPAPLFDLCNDLIDVEEELVAELNCQVACPFERPGASDMLVFLSKSQPGDEYTMEELDQLDSVLRDVTRELASSIGRTGGTTDGVGDSATFAAESLLVDEPDEDVLDAQLEAASTVDTEQELRRHVAKLREILRLGRGFDATFGSSRILDVLVLSLVSLTRSQTVLYFGERAREFQLTHHRGLDPQTMPQMRLHADASLVAAALVCDAALEIEDAPSITDDEKIWARQHGFQFIVPFRSKDHVNGLLILGGAQPIDVDPEMLSYLLHEASLAYDRANLYETLEDRTLGVVRGLMSVIEGHASHDVGSTENVVRYAQAIAREIQYPQAQMRDLVYGAVLRDVGMLRVEQGVLNQTGQLSANEWEDVRRHTLEGATIMRQMRFAETAVEVVLHHHEAYNGEGYPMKLRGRAIPLGARIVAVAEAYVKMTMDRPYRKALGRVEALESLAENWGLRYDPLIVDALVRVVNRELSMGLQGDADFTNHLFGV